MLPRIDTNLIAANQQPIDLTITQLGLRSNRFAISIFRPMTQRGVSRRRPIKGGGHLIVMADERHAFKDGSLPMEILAAPIPLASQISGLSRSEIYRRLAAGDIRAVKSGSRTLVLMDSLRAHLASLPPATFRAPKAA
jgi:hypothetical protein